MILLKILLAVLVGLGFLGLLFVLVLILFAANIPDGYEHGDADVEN